MISKSDRFWITLILRVSFGFLFLAASINIFSSGGPHDSGPDWFARNLSKSFESSWMGDLLPMIENPFRKTTKKAEAQEAKPAEEGAAAAAPDEAAPDEAAPDEEEAAKKDAGKKDAGKKDAMPAAAPAAKPFVDPVHPTYVFLYCLPFIFAALSAPILTGIFLKPALRSGAVLMVMLGVGKYISDGTDLSTTANDFLFAFLICVGLAFIAQGEKEAAAKAAAKAAVAD